MSVAGALDSRQPGEARQVSTAVALNLSPWGRTEYDEWSAVLRRLAISPARTNDLLRNAERCGTSLPDELLASGAVGEEELYRQIAIKLALPFRSGFAPGELKIDVADALALLKSGRSFLVQAVGADGFIGYIAAPRPGDCAQMRGLLRDRPSLSGRISIAPPSILRRALIEIAKPRLKEAARDQLFTREPRFSARFVASAWQGAVLGAIAVGLPLSLALSPSETLTGLHLVATVFFMACVAIRLAAAFGRVEQPAVRTSEADPAVLPVYSILVALRDEVEVIPDLLASLGRLSWPRARLEVKFVCEDDDRRTIDALRAHGLRPWAEIVEVPRGMPGTKPNALTYALALTRGAFVAVYDAEDRPHPLQLYEAWRRFQADDDRLACLQAPLEIDNGSAGLLSRMFALEYAALFHRFLPYLARRGLFLPLGGTSNHFRRAALEDVGAWDPYNVTEDADLGVRLARYGYRTDVIATPTGEDGPDEPMVWLRQRTRWLKGWAQTWLVHMRNPAALASDLGIRSFVAVQILLAGLLVSSLLHPVLLVTGAGLAVKAVATAGLTPLQFFLFVVDAFNIVLGYGAFLLLGWRGTRPAARRGFWKLVLFTPVYWMMMSAAAWRAVIQLRTKPHLWEKTPHTRRYRKEALAGSGSPTRSETPARRR